MSHQHHTQPLASLGPCTVEQCACGVLHVTVGAVTVRLQPETARALATVLDRALASRDAPVLQLHPATLSD
jgi:hypothetical protein